MAAPKKPKNTQYPDTAAGRAAMMKRVADDSRPPQNVNEYGNSTDKPMSGRQSYNQHQKMVGEGKSYLRSQVQVVKDQRVARGQPAVPKVPAGAAPKKKRT